MTYSPMVRRELRCIFPDQTYKSDDKNALSLVLRYEDQEFSGIFTGDISSAEEQYLVEHKRLAASHFTRRRITARDILTVGFPNGTLTGDHNHFLWENNRYGHPGEEALCNIKESGSAVYETMECGRIRIRMENGKPVVEKFLEGR